MGQNQSFNHEATDLTAEDAQPNEEHVQGQRNKNSFTRVTSESESLRGTANTAQVTKILINLYLYNNLRQRLEAA